MNVWYSGRQRTSPPPYLHQSTGGHHRLYAEWITWSCGLFSCVSQSFVKFLLPKNAIRRLFPHHKIKPTLEDGVRPGTGMRKKTDQRGDKKRQERIKLCVKNQRERGGKFFSVPHLPNPKPWKSPSHVSVSDFNLFQPCRARQISSCIAMCAACKHADWKMSFLTADVQCDFCPYLFTKGGAWEGGARWDKIEKKKLLQEEEARPWTKKAKEGNYTGEGTDSRRQQPERPSDGDKWGTTVWGANQREREEKWQRHHVIQRNSVDSESEKNSDKERSRIRATGCAH